MKMSKMFDAPDVYAFLYIMSKITNTQSIISDILDTSFEEKSVWIQLFSLIIVLGTYISIAGTMLTHGVLELRAYVPLFAVAVTLLVILLVSGHIIAAIFGRTELRDERDRLIGWRSESNGSWVMGVGILAAIVGMIFHLPNAWVAHWLLLALFLSELVNLVSQLIYYRRGI
jgi:hypothetical protein